MKIKIKAWCLTLAMFGKIGSLPFGKQIAALIAFPMLLALGWVYGLSALVFYVITALLVGLVFASVYGALSFECDQHPGVIVINNFFGMLVTLMCIPLTLKFAVIGFLLFYGAKYLLPILATKVFSLEPERWPLMATLLGFDIAAGLLINIFLQFVWWMAH